MVDISELETITDEQRKRYFEIATGSENSTYAGGSDAERYEYLEVTRPIEQERRHLAALFYGISQMQADETELQRLIDEGRPHNHHPGHNRYTRDVVKHTASALQSGWRPDASIGGARLTDPFVDPFAPL